MSDLHVSPQASHLRDTLHQRLQTLADGRGAYGLLDFPNHFNIGDSAIWVGAMSLLPQIHGSAPEIVALATLPVARVCKTVPQDGVLYIQGGGNFGDLWPHHHKYRLRVLQTGARHRVVQLPQSIHFGSENPAMLEHTKRVIAAHPDFHLILRDTKSYDFAKAQFDCEIYLAPDCAFSIDMSQRPARPAPSQVFHMFRDDIEQRLNSGDIGALFQDVPGQDWPLDGDRVLFAKKTLSQALRLLQPWAVRGPMASALFLRLARARLERGFRLLETGTVIVTDRLHGHLMASLLGKTTIVVDNVYGKTHGLISTWGAVAPTYLATSYAQAREIADALVAGEARAPDAGPGATAG